MEPPDLDFFKFRASIYRVLVDPLNDDLALGHDGRQRSQCRQRRQQQSAHHAQRQRDFQQGLSVFVFNGNTANVALANQFPDRRNQVFATDAQFFGPRLLQRALSLVGSVF